jgi:hypothetical protein
MKRLLLGFSIFLVAFFSGYIVGPKFRTTFVDNITPQTTESFTHPNSNSAAAVPLEFLEEIDDNIAAPDKFTIQLLETGSNFHADQIPAKNGEQWLGLFNNGGTYSLRNTTLRIKRVADELVHGPSSDVKGKLTGKSVAVETKVEPLLLLKNAHRLREGLVTTLFEGEKEDWKNESAKPAFLDKNFHQTYKLDGKIYELRVIKAKNRMGEPLLALRLEGDGVKQLLHTFWTRSEGENGEKNWLGSVGTLYWVGDIDGDKKPDFYLSLYAHETIYTAFLLLSSEAEKGNLVKQVAVFETSGCG